MNDVSIVPPSESKARLAGGFRGPSGLARLVRGALIPVGIATVLVAAGCGSSDSESDKRAATSETPAAKANARVDLPDEITKKGRLKVATSADNPPLEFIGSDGKTIEGFDADFARALGEATGVEFDLTNVGFDSIIPGLAANKYDIAIAGIFDKPERREVLSFVNYQVQGTNLIVEAHNPSGIEGFDQLCGKTVSALKASAQAGVVAQESKKACADKSITTQVYPDVGAATLAVASGRAVAAAVPAPVGADIAEKQPKRFASVGRNYGALPVGIAIPNEQKELITAIDAAVQSLIDDGTYAELMTKWGLEDCCSVDSAEISSGS